MNLKHQAASKALEFVQDGMRLGLGSGSTAAVFVDLLGERLRQGEVRDIVCAATSESTARRARELGLPLVPLAGLEAGAGDLPLDLAVDGADEVDPQLDLIKGLGRALLREKIVEIHTRRLVIIVDVGKLVPRLGRGPLPVELVPFEWQVHLRWLNGLGCRAELWREADGSPVVTDNGNYLARLQFPPGGIPDPHELARRLACRPGIVEHGLFLDMAAQVIVAGETGIRVLERER